MMEMLRGQQAFDPSGFAAVPEQFKQGLACQERMCLTCLSAQQLDPDVWESWFTV
jgi:hypothetical protein